MAKRRFIGVLLGCLAAGQFAFGQGTIVALNTGGGQPLVTEERTVNVSSNLQQPRLEFSFGFATDESVVPGKLLDSFTVTIQDTNQTLTAILSTSDASGTVLAPVTPGTVVIDPASISLTPIAYPSLNPVLASQQAFRVSAAVPQQFFGGPINVFFDLFDNQDALASQGWFSDLRVVAIPEPQPWALGVLGAAMAAWRLRCRGRLTSNPRSCGRLVDAPEGKDQAGISSGNCGGRVRQCIRRGSPASARWPRFLKRSTAKATQIGSVIGHGCWPLLFLAGFSLVPTGLAAAEASFNLHGAVITLEEATTDTGVYFTSMRLNRAAQVWNVEVSLTNHGARVLQGPLVLLVDAFSGTTGPLQPDGVDSSGKPFFDLSPTVPNGILSPSSRSLTRTLTLGFTNGVPNLSTRVFVRPNAPPSALGLTRTLDEAGQPLPNVQVIESGLLGVVTNRSDPVFGVITLGQAGGPYTWQFSAPGYLPVWRQQTLVTNEVTVLANPRLVQQATNAFQLTPIAGGQVTNATGTIQILFPPGTVVQNTTARLTPLTGQTLPAFLPLGWSPLQAFDLSFGFEPSRSGTASLTLLGPLANRETGALVRWNPASLHWEVIQTVSGAGSAAISVPIPGSGTYALVAGDFPPLAPPTPQAGQPLLPGSVSVPDLAAVTATGTVEPISSPASRVPDLVTATATVTITNPPGPLPSGLLLRGEVQEQYKLANSTPGLPPAALGTVRHPPQYETFLVGYQRPGSGSTLQASFPLRPLLLFGAEDLDQATVTMDVLTPTPFAGTVLETNGGLIATAGISVLAGAGDLLTRQAAQLRYFDPTNFTDFSGMPPGVSVLAAFELTIGSVAPGHRLVAQFSSPPTNSLFVLARVLYDQGLYGLQPLERLTSDSLGRLSSAEPLSGERLGGLTGAGQYLLLKLGIPQGLVEGTARNSAGQATAGMPVTIAGEPWLAFSASDGSFHLLAPTGAVQVAVTDLTSGDTGVANITVTNTATTVLSDAATVPTGPQVTSISPTNGATVVSRVSPIIISFSEPVNPATLLGTGVQLLGTNGVPVATSLTLNLKNTAVTLLPTYQLDAATLFTVVLSSNITDVTGNKLAGANSFAFTTESDLLNRSAAQLIIFAPGATNIPPDVLTNLAAFVPGQENDAVVVHGTAGSAEPGQPAILANESSGETSTVLSQSDGSFYGVVHGSEDDFISTTLVNANGTRNYLPVSRQLFDDGFVGLYHGGGILEAQSDAGPIQVTVQPGTIQSRTKFQLQVVALDQLQGLLSNTPPTDAQLVGDAIQLHVDGDKLNTGNRGIDISFPLTDQRLSDLGFPPGADPSKATYLLTVPTRVQGDVTFCVVDTMEYDNGKLVTHSAPFPGSDLFLSPDTVAAALGTLDLITTFVDPIGSSAQTLLMAPLTVAEHDFPVKFTGKTIQLNVDAAKNPVSARAVAGAFVTVRPSGAGALSSATPGRLDPGTVYCLSQVNGAFALALPPPEFSLTGQSGDFILTATHPRFPGMRVAQLAAPAQATISLNDLVFVVETNQQSDLRPPALSVSHEPEFPAPGTSNTASLLVLATHSTGPPQVDVTFDSISSLIANVTLGKTNVTIGTATTAPVGANGVRAVFSIGCDRPARVRLKVHAGVSGPAQPEEVGYEIDFGGSEPSTTNPPPADINDQVAPRVVFTDPQEGARAVGLNQSIHVQFSEAIMKTVLNDSSLITLTPDAGQPELDLSPDQQVLTISYPQLQPDKDYTLSISSSVRDLAGNQLDQVPSTSTPDNFVLDFHTAPALSTALPNVSYGGGTVIRGIYAYVLERAGALDGSLKVYDLSDPTAPAKVGELGLPGFPRDLTLIPNYAYKLTPNGVARTNDMLAVVGGKTGGSPDSSGVLLGGFQYLWIIDISSPTNPTRIASADIVLSFETTVSKIQWSPPTLAYLEASSELTSVGLVDLQTFILGSNMTPDDYSQFPEGRAGVDADHNGDYVGPNDTLPLPARNPAQFAGEDGSFPIDETTQRILDFDFDAPTFTLGVALSTGVIIGPDGLPSGVAVPASYRTLASGNLDLERRQASVNFPDRSLKRVKLLMGVPLTITNQLQVVNLAVVSLEPSSSAPAQIVVIDITDPTAPHILQQYDIPARYGSAQSILERDDGTLLLATSTDELILDPTRFNQPPANGTLPIMTGVLPGLGSGARSFGSLVAGLNTVSLGGKNVFTLTEPRLTFVQLTAGSVFSPSTLVDHPDLVQSNLSVLQPALFLSPARFRTATNIFDSSLAPAARESHYYVRVDAPGSAGESIPVLLESLNSAGYPLRNRGNGFPPVRAADGQTLDQMNQKPGSCDATIRALTAYRLSSRKGDPNYNVFISRAFALGYEAMSEPDLQQLRNTLDREVIWSGAFLRASLDPAFQTNKVLGAFCGRVNGKDLTVDCGTEVVAEALPADYIMGPNPPPVNGATHVPGTSGTVAAHNGECRLDTVDFALPGRRLPIVFERHYGGQDLYEGPFGRGWDFNYNQRLEELKGQVFPPGSKMPLVIRGNSGDEIGQSQDILFHPGDGRVILFAYASNAPPAGYQDDLVQDLQWDIKGVGFYLPPEGIFDMLVRFGDGHYARLTPEGTRFWYARDGRLEKIQDRYTNNIIELEYNRRGELRRIIDRSGSDRSLEIGYYRATSSDIESGTPDAVVSGGSLTAAGLICALRDHLGSATQRDVQFEYDDCRRLVTRKGINVTSANQDGFTGSELTTYHFSDDPRFVSANGGIGVSEGSTTGAPLFSGTSIGGTTAPQVQTGVGANGQYQINLQQPNSAQAMASGNAKTIVTGPDNSTGEYQFDTNGQPSSITLKGDFAADAPAKFEFENGLVKKITYPEGNSVTYTYDKANRSLRARGNILMLSRDPGPRGGPSIPTASFQPYDSRYNFPVGTFTDFNGNTITYAPTSDGLDIGKITYADAGTVETTYNEFGQITNHKSIEGFDTHYGPYDADGFLLERDDGDLPTQFTYGGDSGKRGLPTTIRPPEGAAYDPLVYNERDELITLNRGAFFEKRSHDINGYVVRLERAVSSSASLVETAQYLQNGFMTNVAWQQIETDGGTRDLQMFFTPDAAFRVTAITYPGGEVRTYTRFDHLGRPHHMEIGTTDKYTEDYVYDLNGNLRSITRGGAATDTYGYDGYDRLATVQLALDASASEQRTMTYYGNGELHTLTVLDSQGQVNLDHQYEIDSAGRVTKLTATSDSGTAITRYSFDQGARTETITSPVDGQVVMTHNTAGQLTSLDDQPRNASSSYDYQSGTELKHLTSQENGRNFFRNLGPYTALNQLLHLDDNVGTLGDFQPRIDGRNEVVTDGSGRVTHFTYSKLGETLSEKRDNKVEFRHDYRPQRAPGHTGDNTGAGHTYTYDNGFRLQTFTLRNPQSLFTVTGSDPRNNTPLVATIPGGQVTYGRDAKGRMTSRTVAFRNGSRSETWGFDALDRVNSATFPAGSTTITYDKLGPISSVIETLGQQNYMTTATIRGDRARLSLTYPNDASGSPVTIQEGRDLAGRLTTVVPDSADPVIQQITYGGADFVAQQVLGPGLIQCTDTRDGRKRLTARSYKLQGSGKLLAEVHYVYDAADNLLAQQFLHRAGRTDLFTYDNGNRLARAETGARPFTSEAALRAYSGFAFDPLVPGQWSPGYYSRAYGYSADGLDTSTGMTETNPDAVSGQTAAQSYSGTDAFLNIQNVDGVTRSSDELGDTTQTRLIVRRSGQPLPQAVTASLTYNGLSQLVRVAHDNVVINYDYQQDGLLCYRTIDDPGLPGGHAETAFVWHEGSLLAEFDRSMNGNQLRARYYYGNSDVPVAADIADSAGALHRYYLLQEANGSVMGLVDSTGQVVERYTYDAWGQPQIQGPDSTPPHIRNLVSEGTNLLVELSERILPPLQSPPADGLADQLTSLAGALSVSANGGAVPGNLELAEQVGGFAFGTVLRFRPTQPLTGACNLTLAAGAVLDEANNLNLGETITNFTFDPTPGKVLFAAADQSSTASPTLTRSAVGSPMLFHGQFFDYDAGLSYMRARFYDPYSGLFLQPDPEGYEDSPNLYAAFANNPTSYRDPSGTVSLLAAVRGALARGVLKAAKFLSRITPELRPVSKFLARTGKFIETGSTIAQRVEGIQFVRYTLPAREAERSALEIAVFEEQFNRENINRQAFRLPANEKGEIVNRDIVVIHTLEGGPQPYHLRSGRGGEGGGRIGAGHWEPIDQFTPKWWAKARYHYHEGDLKGFGTEERRFIGQELDHMEICVSRDNILPLDDWAAGQQRLEQRGVRRFVEARGQYTGERWIHPGLSQEEIQEGVQRLHLPLPITMDEARAAGRFKP